MALGKAVQAGDKAAKTKKTQNNTVVPDQDVVFSMLEVNKIHPDPEQPRKEWTPEEQAELQANIKTTKGCTSPIRVRPHPELIGEYMLVYGEGRWTSHSNLGDGFELIPSLLEVKEFNNYERTFIQVSENVSRYKMKAIYEAKGYQALIDQSKEQEPKKITQKQLAARLGLSSTYISRVLKLLKAPEAIQQLSLDGVTQSTNTLSYLEQLSRLVDEDELLKIIDSVRDGQLGEHDLQKKITKLKKPKEETKQDDIDNQEQYEGSEEYQYQFEETDNNGQPSDPLSSMTGSDSNDNQGNVVNNGSDYGFYNYQDPYEKALFDALFAIDAAYDITEEQKDEAAQKLVDVTKENLTEHGYSIEEQLNTLRIVIPLKFSDDANEAIKTILNIRKLRAFFNDEFKKIADLQNMKDNALTVNSVEYIGGTLFLNINGLEQPLLLTEDDLEAIKGA